MINSIHCYISYLSYKIFMKKIHLIVMKLILDQMILNLVELNDKKNNMKFYLIKY